MVKVAVRFAATRNDVGIVRRKAFILRQAKRKKPQVKPGGK